MIPDEAVEAVAKAIYHDGWDGPPYWESLADDHSDKVRVRFAAQKALEAAAPYLMASSAESNREYLEQFREWEPGDPIE